MNARAAQTIRTATAARIECRAAPGNPPAGGDEPANQVLSCCASGAH